MAKHPGFVAMAAALLLAACTVYQTAPGYYTTAPGAGFDRAWAAAVGAMEDQGVRLTRVDRSAGVVEGTREGVAVGADVRTQADGSVRVAFSAKGDTSRDPDLLNRVSRSYDRRMGR